MRPVVGDEELHGRKLLPVGSSSLQSRTAQRMFHVIYQTVGQSIYLSIYLVSLQPAGGGPSAQVRLLGPKVDSHLALFCIHQVNRVNSRNDSES